jgi:uncharacterized protein (TIGR00369 family)
VEQESARQVSEAFRARSRGTLIERMGISVVEASAQRVVATMPVAGNTQPYGLLHGGASCVLAETIGSLGAALHAGPGRNTVGIEISATHHRSAASGLVTGVATRLYGGRTVTTYEVIISDDRNRRVCTARLTCLLSDRALAGDTAAATGAFGQESGAGRAPADGGGSGQGTAEAAG